MEIIVIAGATATGKSELAIQVAQEIDAQIINADSMQIYKGMNIGTAKLSIAERGGIEHHLLDILDVSKDSTVAWYQGLAREKVSEIHSQGKNVVIVGGTGLYIKSILDELNFPDTDPMIRKSLEIEAERIGGDALFSRLEKLDPAAAIAIDRANLRRVIRALEVIEITGKPFTANLPREESSRYPKAMQFGLVMERDHLIDRIDARVEKMWQLGFIEEVRACIANGMLEGRTSQLALGYSQIVALLNGTISEDEAKEDTKRATRQYARRQETWFSRDERIQWISPTQPRLERVMEVLASR